MSRLPTADPDPVPARTYYEAAVQALAGLSRWGQPADPVIETGPAMLRDPCIVDAVRRAVEAAPPISDEQGTELSAIIAAAPPVHRAPSTVDGQEDPIWAPHPPEAPGPATPARPARSTP